MDCGRTVDNPECRPRPCICRASAVSCFCYAKTDLSTENKTARAGARVSRADAHDRRPSHPCAPTRQRAAPSGYLNMLPREHRLTRDRDIDAVWKFGASAGTPILGAKARPNRLSQSRFAVIAGLKVHKRAVKRNLIKRRIREALRARLSEVETGADVVVSARAPAVGASFEDIRQALDYTFKKLGLWAPTSSSR